MIVEIQHNSSTSAVIVDGDQLGYFMRRVVGGNLIYRAVSSGVIRDFTDENDAARWIEFVGKSVQDKIRRTGHVVDFSALDRYDNHNQE